MAHVTSGKVKTNMFLIWCGPDGGDMCNNFELTDNKMYDTDYVMNSLSCIVNQFAIFVLPDISSVKCPKGKIKQQMHSIIAFKNSVYNASSMTTKNI